MKPWIRVALIFAGFAVAVLLPGIFPWEGKGRFWSVAASLIIIAAASMAGTANFIKDPNSGFKKDSEGFEWRPRGVEIYIAGMIFVIGVIMMFTRLLQW